MKAYSIEDLRQVARRRLPRSIFDFFDGGAEEERTLRDNRAAFERLRVAPRVLVDVAQVDTSANILGAPAKLPICIAPTGAAGFGWRGGDLAIARCAAARGIPYTLSTAATASIEAIAEAAPGRLWFQAYIFQDRSYSYGLIERARRAGYEALVVTADVPVGGKRERDNRNQLTVPFRYTPRNMLDFATRPLWALDMLLRGVPQQENLTGMAPRKVEANAGTLASSVGRGMDASLDWEALKTIRDLWPGKLLLKGVLREDDATRAVSLGCDGVIVSNHGGRQLDGAVAALDALPAIVRAVGGRASVLMDGGVRRGADVFKALALGAEAVLVGRATLFGVSAYGEPGARRALDILADELVRTMQLSGTRRLEDIGPELLFRDPSVAALVEELEGDAAAVAGDRRPRLVGDRAAS